MSSWHPLSPPLSSTLTELRLVSLLLGTPGHSDEAHANLDGQGVKQVTGKPSTHGGWELVNDNLKPWDRRAKGI